MQSLRSTALPRSRPRGSGIVPFIPHILVVDDEPTIRNYICECLALRSSYRVQRVPVMLGQRSKSPAEPRIDVALLDQSIPDEDGVSLARRLRHEVRDLPRLGPDHRHAELRRGGRGDGSASSTTC